MKYLTLDKREKGVTTQTTWEFGYHYGVPNVWRVGHSQAFPLGQIKVTHKNWYAGTPQEWTQSLRSRILYQLMERGLLIPQENNQ